MKERYLEYALVSFMLLFPVFVLPLSAQKSYFSVHVTGGSASPDEDQIDSGIETSFGVSFAVTDHFSLAADFSYWRSSVKEETGRLLNGKLGISPFCISVQYFLARNKVFVPYVFGGGGIVFAGFKMEEYISIPEVTISQKVASGIGFLGGAGAEIRLKENIAFFAEAFYIRREARGTTVIHDMNFGTSSDDFSLSLSSAVLRIGLKYFI